ncbi:methionine--tRNA ligase [Pseudomonas aeruginosa]|uniref:methionine--tRNA ligase n=1 Tax=Pseudomonas aeruginosa TaxID=287 RepID=UPI003CC52A64
MDKTQRQFFLMPIPPTPNGRLHLGHIAGPYLRMDIVGRYLRTQGHKVETISAVNGFDSYVLWKGVQEGRSPHEVCQDYHAQIAKDLEALDIQVDDFLELVSGPFANGHARRTRTIVEKLVALGVTETVTERVLFSRTTNRYIVGAWLVGQCPYCKSNAAGYFCEACGALIQPQRMVGPKPRLGDADLEWRDIETLFLSVADRPALVQRIEAYGAPREFLEIAHRHLERENGLIRLTAPGQWGVSWDADRFGNPRVLFEAGWEHALTCGACYESRGPTRAHPMERNGRITSLVSFGIDNAVLLLVASIAILDHLCDRQPFNHVLTNYFCNLQGSKFSTSRLHVIWAADIVNMTPATSDAIRLFLAKENPEQGETNFDLGGFIHFVNHELVDLLQTRIATAGDTLLRYGARSLEMSPAQKAALPECLLAHDSAFCLDAVSIRSAYVILRAWMSLPPEDLTNAPSAYGWLKVLAYLAFPIMPTLGKALWVGLGCEGDPRREVLLDASRPQVQGMSSSWFLPLSIELLRPCLPTSFEHQTHEEGAKHAQ